MSAKTERAYREWRKANPPKRFGPLTWNEPLGDPACPYLYRWMLRLPRGHSLRLHRWLRSDDTRAMHDHPQDFWTLVLKGMYYDVTEDGDGEHEHECLGPGSLRHRKAEHVHYVWPDPWTNKGCWTLLWFKPERRKWGFWVDGKWRAARSYFWAHGHESCPDEPSQEDLARHGADGFG